MTDTVTSVVTGSPVGVVTITLSGGSRFFVLQDLFDRCGLGVGDEVELERMEAIQRESARRRVRAKLLDLLSRREYTRWELELHAQERGFDSAVSSEVIESLAAEGLQDDARFASAWLASRLRRRPEGRRNLLMGLSARGVSGEIAAEALSDLDRESPRWEEDALRRAHERAARRSDDPAAITRTLRRNGFEFSQILRYNGWENGLD